MAIKDPENNIQVSLNYNTVLQWLPVNWSNWDFALNHWHTPTDDAKEMTGCCLCLVYWGGRGTKRKKEMHYTLQSAVKAWQWLIMRQCVQGNRVLVNIQSTWQKQLYVTCKLPQIKTWSNYKWHLQSPRGCRHREYQHGQWWWGSPR